MIEHGQQLGLVGVQSGEQAIEGDETGAAAEDAVEADAELAAPARCRPSSLSSRWARKITELLPVP